MSEQGPSGFAVWTVLRRDPLTAANASLGTESLAQAVAGVEAGGVVVRGLYDVSVLRADADLMLWLHGDTAEALQAAVRRLRRSTELSGLALTWSAMGVHRSAEFNKAHVPGFLRGERARTWLTVYPFVRSYDWYVLPDDERRAMLAEHGRKGAAFRSVIANTVSAFALNDYEWLLPMESDELTDLVDMMRDLRATKARLHVREEVPFFTGRLIALDQVAEVLA
ncbi:hydrogen peroxide-dependent heme synthase [Micropruina sp.]|uniref:hydrogen peroxide-dependent heme synthase n=1 Tax=Micropruina sp. TaxID=2737536 RepID=UPI0039E530AA